MEAESGIPKQVQIVHADDKSMRLNDEALRKLLSANHIKDKPVAVVSVCGPLRSGKSFLLGFFLRFLYSLHLDNWLGDPNAPLKGFKWRGGTERHTVGIVVWDEVFLVKTSSGEEIAVLLMDTQGMYDCESTVQQTANIFALTALTSSVQVYNIWTNIDENDLQYLEFFSEYGRLVKEQMEGKPFQKLQFLVRDWYYPTHWAYGFTGGRRFLSERLRTYKGQHEQLKQRRENIDSNFKEVDCFLMPHPGLKVAREPSFDGRLRDIDEDFTTQLSSLIPSLLSPDHLIAKKINNKKITCHQLIAYFKSYVDVFNSGGLPKPVSLYQATVETSNMTAMMDAWNLYQIAINQIYGKVKMPVQRLQRYHSAARRRALNMFIYTPKMGSDDLSSFYLEKLKQQDTTYSYEPPANTDTWRALSRRGASQDSSEAVAVRRSEIVHGREDIGFLESQQSTDGRGEVCDKTLALIHSESVDGDLKTDVLGPRGNVDGLEQGLDCSNALKAVAVAKAMYQTKMQEICGEDELYISLPELDWHHCNQRQIALENLASIFKANGTQLPEHIVTGLKQEMDEAFKTFANLNQRKDSVLVRFQSWLRGTTDQSVSCRIMEI